ncbi:MAG: CHAT domain-containing protein, partial [Planctomycetota bacterium]|nr:CHAT domain-containing protein [Planctomycetota bacterium]
MRTLRITQSDEHAGHSRVSLRLEIPNQPPKEPPAIDLRFDFTPQDQEDLRWYLEDYLQYPLDPAPTIAARVEARLADLGRQLFTSLFPPGDPHDLFTQLRDHLPDTRIEIITSVHEAASIPWELLRDPKTDSPLALHAHSFVRTLPNPARSQYLPEPTPGPIRILLVICRPNADEDVPFRSVAAYILKGLTDDARANFKLEVLRPPTFEQLAKKLRDAHANNTPYHAVHFDGHGTYLESPDTKLSDLLKQFSALLLTGPREGSHGYLAFENPAVKENVQLVDGPTLGRLLADTRVPILLLNSCRSAYADPPPTPSDTRSPTPATHPDPHTQIRAFGTLAQEIIHEGVSGVLAMRYNLYVVTGAQFVADLYAALAQGHSLGQAVTLGRKQLAAQPLREIAFDPIPLQDWPVPVIYEAVPLSLFPKLPSPDQHTLTLTTKPTRASQGEINLPPRPDIGFFGRDETLLALDRAFDTQRIVLLHAFAGSGKTTTAAEFARWYALTGGVHGPILFTSFQQHLTLPRVLDTLGTVFNDALEQNNIHWLALTDPQRRDIALQILNQAPVLWIWDNIEPIAGFPAGSQSQWTDPEQQELRDFLRSATQTKSKFLLTS